MVARMDREHRSTSSMVVEEAKSAQNLQLDNQPTVASAIVTPPPKTKSIRREPIAERNLAPFESKKDLLKLELRQVLVEMMEYRVPVNSIACLQGEKLRPRMSKFTKVLNTLRRYIPEDEKKYIDLRYVPVEGPENVNARNLFFKKTSRVTMEAVAGINAEYLSTYNEILESNHEKKQLERLKEGKKRMTYKEKTGIRVEIGALYSMIQQVEKKWATEDKQKKAKASTMMNHFKPVAKKS